MGPILGALSRNSELSTAHLSLAHPLSIKSPAAASPQMNVRWGRKELQGDEERAVKQGEELDSKTATIQSLIGKWGWCEASVTVRSKHLRKKVGGQP